MTRSEGQPQVFFPVARECKSQSKKKAGGAAPAASSPAPGVERGQSVLATDPRVRVEEGPVRSYEKVDISAVCRRATT